MIRKGAKVISDIPEMKDKVWTVKRKEGRFAWVYLENAKIPELTEWSLGVNHLTEIKIVK